MAKTLRTIKNPFFTSHPPSPFLHFSLLFFSPPKRASPRYLNHHHNHQARCSPQQIFLLLISLSLVFSGISFLASSSSGTCVSGISSSPLGFFISSDDPRRLLTSLAVSVPSTLLPLPARGGRSGNMTEEESEFWKQPNGEGYRPCLEFSLSYRKKAARVSKERKRFLVVVVSGGLNQQRNQIVDAVVIAAILEAALVVPVLQVNRVWVSSQTFSTWSISRKRLNQDVRVVSSLPSTHLMSRQTIENQIPWDVSPVWIRAKFFKQLNEEGLLVLKGLDSRLAKNLPPDLQKLRCKVAFHALRFTAPIESLGNRLARRMWIEGPYIALHLRLEKDVWVRTGCLTGLGSEFDRIIAETRMSQPRYLTGRLNLTYTERRLAGLCPLNAYEIARLLKALGAPRNASETLAHKGELLPYTNRSSALAAIDYIVSLSSDVFLPSHGGNMAKAMQGNRAYVGHRKFVMPNKRAMLPLMENPSVSDSELSRVARKLHGKSQGHPESRRGRRDRDVLAYPVPECMCRHAQIPYPEASTCQRHVQLDAWIQSL
ncbi:O-fucosyltransferase 37 [Hirschfeldia incana]|nr:O-fucosyltransferase 37 [Hirschfeldia incana]